MTDKKISGKAIILSLAMTNLGPAAVAVENGQQSTDHGHSDLNGLVAGDDFSMLSGDQRLLAGVSPEPMFGTECFDGAVDSSGIPLLPDLSLSAESIEHPSVLVGDDVFLRTELLNRGRDCAPDSLVTFEYDAAFAFVAPHQQCDAISATSIECRFGDVTEGNTSTALLQFSAISPLLDAQINATASTIIEEEFLINNETVVEIQINPGDIDFSQSTLTVVTDSALADGTDMNTLRATVRNNNGNLVINAVVNFTIASGEGLLIDDSCVFNGNCTVEMISLIPGDNQISASIGNQALSGSPVTVTFDDPGPEQIQFTSSLIESMEDTGIIELPVIRSGILTGPVTYTAISSDITAESSNDFIFPAGQSLRWGAGNGSNQTLLLSFVNDLEPEFPETFQLELVPVSGTASPGPNATTTIRIYDDDTAFFANSFED